MQERIKSIKINQIEIFFNLLKNERPLLIIYAVKHLAEFFCLNNSTTINFDQLCSWIRSYYIQAIGIAWPGIVFEFLKSQINLMMQNQCEFQEKERYNTIAIESHIASLRRPSNVFLTDLEKENNPQIYFPIYTSKSEPLHYLVESDSSGKEPEKPSNMPSSERNEKESNVSIRTGEITKCKYIPVSEMPCFSEEPLTSFSFTGALDDCKIFFTVRSFQMIEPKSSLFVFQYYILKVASPPYQNGLIGRKLEYLGAIASVLSSRYANGCFFKFIERFAYHLTHENVEWKLKTNNLTPKCARFIDQFFVPVLAPINGSWDEDFKTMLGGYLEEKLHWKGFKKKNSLSALANLFPMIDNMIFPF
jgi:hypothetical protein